MGLLNFHFLSVQPWKVASNKDRSRFTLSAPLLVGRIPSRRVLGSVIDYFEPNRERLLPLVQADDLEEFGCQ